MLQDATGPLANNPAVLLTTFVGPAGPNEQGSPDRTVDYVAVAVAVAPNHHCSEPLVLTTSQT